MKTSLDNIKPLVHCSVCDRKHETAKALLLAEDDGRTVFHLTCAACGVSTVVLVSSSQFGVVSMGVLTDLDGSEAGSLFGNEAISGDQVLDVHAFFKEFKGGVKEFI